MYGDNEDVTKYFPSKYNTGADACETC